MSAKLWRLLFPKLPFEIAMPYRQTVKTLTDALSIIRTYNGVKRLFFSLYTLDSLPQRQNPPIDKIWFDFDSPNAQRAAQKMLDCVNGENLKHLIVFSGGGFHFYIFTQNGDKMSDARSALKAMHKDIAEKAKCSIGPEKIADIDYHIIGDISRVVTIPNTYNVKRRKFAIPLRDKELDWDIEKIKELANKPREDWVIEGEKLFDCAPYQRIENGFADINIPNLANIDNDVPEDISMFPPCIQAILLDKKKFNGQDGSCGDWRGRWLFTVWMKEAGYSPDVIDKLAKKYFSQRPRSDNLRDNYEHWKKVKALELAFRHDHFFPTCEKMWLEGRCPGKCKWYNGQRL